MNQPEGRLSYPLFHVWVLLMQNLLFYVPISTQK